MQALTLPRLSALPLMLHLAFACAAGQNDAILPEVSISAHADEAGYRAKRSATATKTDTALQDIPQAITVIGQAMIGDLAMQSMGDVVRYTPGIGMANGEGNRDAPIFRGSSNASGDFYLDGTRDDVEYYRDLYNVERVEALTGPNAMIFGRGGSGGVLNRVTKQAGWETRHAADLTLGSYRNRHLTVDLGQAANDTLAWRVAGLAEDSGGYQREASLKRRGVNPTLAIRAGRDTSVVLGFEHFEDRRNADSGVPSLNGRPLALPVDAFFGYPDPAARPIALSSNGVSAVLEHAFGNGVLLSNKTRYTDYDKSYQNYNGGAIDAKTASISISAYNNHQWRKNLFNQTDLTVELERGGVRHTLLAGLELGTQDTDYLRKTGVFANGASTVSVPLAHADGALPVNFVLGGSNSDRDGSSQARVAGLYAQDQMELSPQWQLIAGLRLDSFRLDYHNHRAGGLLKLLPAQAELSSSDRLVSPRAGLVYKPQPQLSLYASYSVASVPRGGDQLSGLSTVNQGLAPEKFTNHEIGAKWEATPQLMATVALYRLRRNNVAVVDPQTGIADRLVDGQRNRGVEIGLNGKLSKAWSISGGYAHQDAVLLATASATALNGATIGMVPKNTLSLWNRYDFTPSLAAGLGLIYRSDMYASTSNVVTLPAATRIDAAVFYTVNAQLKLQANVENLADRRYYLSANGDNNITPASPRAIKLGLHATF